MNSPVGNAAREGLRRGIIEFRHLLTDRSDLTASVGFGLLPLAVLVYFDRTGQPIEVAGTTVAHLHFLAPGLFASIVVFGTMSPMYYLAAERDDGTLLRARSLPNGVVGHAVGRSVTVTLEALLGLALVLGPSLVPFPQLRGAGIIGWTRFAAVFALGMVAILPLGLVIGSFLRSTKGIFSIGVAMIAGVCIVSVFSLHPFPRLGAADEPA